MSAPDISRLWDRLDAEEKQMLLERRRLQDIWLKISQMHRENEEAREAMEKEANMTFVPGDTRIVLNVGGQLFETTAETLCQDRYSLLAALCLRRPAPPVQHRELPEGRGRAFFIDRDWWVFNPILHFLRTGVLPSDMQLLEELYAEASFYRLHSLRVAIETRAKDAASAETPLEWPVHGGAHTVPGRRGAQREAYRLADPHHFLSDAAWR